jgi:hypothetical protein
VITTTNLASLSATIAGTSITASAVDTTAKVSYDPVNGFQATTSCSLLSAEGTAQLKVGTATVTLGADCSYTPITIPGVLSVGPTKSVNCQTGPNGQLCTASVCALSISVLEALSGVNSITVCLGKATASADFKPVTQTGGVVVTSQIPSPTFFLGVVGATTTNPKAVAGALPRQVTDVSPAVFADAPYAVSYYATEQTGGASFCNGSYGPLLPGCNYTVWGSGVDRNSAMDEHVCMPVTTHCWQGQLSSTSSHAQGQYVTAVAGAGGGPSPFLSGSKYLLLPVIGTDGKVLQYGMFQSTSDSKIYTLVRTPDPSTSLVVPLAQSETTGDWIPTDEGAVATKLVDPSYFNSSGWS